jgi:hypothetical protein
VRVHVRQQDETPVVPKVHRLLIGNRVVRDQFPAGPMPGALIVGERGDVDVHVVRCLLADPRVHRTLPTRAEG